MTPAFHNHAIAREYGAKYAGRPRADVALVARYMTWRTGWSLDGERVTTILDASMHESGYARPESYVRALHDSAELFQTLAERLANGESYFFREPWHFRFMEEELLPEAERRLAAGEPGLSMWSAGCADGQEIYSVAILLAEAGLLGESLLHGSDLSAAAVNRARSGRYREWAIRGSESERVKSSLAREDATWVLDPRFREAVTFAVQNLADPFPSTFAGHFDAVLCRNVLIYFDRDTTFAVARRLAASLRPGGWLITGSSDPTLTNLELFESVRTPHGVVYRKR